MISHLKHFLHFKAWRATGIIFAICGFYFGTWAAFIPYVMDKHHLDEAELGLLLLCIPVGTLIANPLSIWIISRLGAARTSLIFIALMGITFAIPILCDDIYLVAVGLMLAGGMFAVTNIAMNTCAADLIDTLGLSLMSACHGMWSLGAMMGALLAGPAVLLISTFDAGWMSPHMIYESAFLVFTLMVIFANRRDLLKTQENWELNKHPGGAGKFNLKPNRALWILITISLCTFLTEGTMADWSGVYLKDVAKAPAMMVGWGFGVYAFFMAAGRFVGDKFIERYGHITVLMAGGMMVVVGLLVVVLLTHPWWVLPGFMLIGLGVSVASPILYGEAAKVPGLPRGAGLATLNSFAMAAFLGGPVLIGFLAKALDLRTAFLFVAASAVWWVVQTRIMLRKRKGTTTKITV